MIEKAFSPEFRRLIGVVQPRIEVGLVGRDCEELVVAAVFALKKENVVWVVGENENVDEKMEKLGQWLRFFRIDDDPIQTHLLPFEDPYSNNRPDLARIESKIRLLRAVRRGAPLIVVTTLAALSIRVETDLAEGEPQVEVKAGSICARNSLIQRLTELGYISRTFVENKGDIAWRGNVIDIFPLNHENPVRIEFEGDRVVSLRSFDLDTQRSIGAVPAISIFQPRYFFRYPGCEEYFSGKKEGMVFLTELLERYTMIVSGFAGVESVYRKLLANYERIGAAAGREKKMPVGIDSIFDFPYLDEKIVDILPFPGDPTAEFEIVPIAKTILTLTTEDIDQLKEKVRQGYRLHLFAAEAHLAENLRKMIPVSQYDPFAIPFSFENPRTMSIFLTSRRFQYHEKIEHFKEINVEKWIQEIQPDDYVVHQVHGIGRFIGLKRLLFEGISSEFLKIEYQNHEYLYVPTLELDVLSRFNSYEGHLPVLDRLGGKTWGQKKSRARRAVTDFARELLELYALRRSIKGQRYIANPDLEDRLQQEFVYVETEDQKRAIRQVFADLEMDHPMDRLICGDVSFGKTEVALRAALRVALNGKQVAFLCPTTILAFQHFQNFEKRLSSFPVRVAMMSRFVSGREKERAVRDIREGKIDIVIGTHSLLARPIEFKRLGLFIIDEEQRFGVFQKEKLKKGREDVDVLTLSATPIPRTLSFSLAGLQDISLIRTPPIGRLAVKNFIGCFSRELLVSAVLNEIDRDGSVFIVYNNIERIFSFKEKLAQWLPDISIGVLHAKLNSETIEKNLLDFIHKKYSVLLSTTIIENGIDIPAVNTLIVVDADRFGLTQLYQLRGRIGRSNRQAFAYFLIDPERHGISDTAQKRLEAIRQFSDLGSGYKIAEFDLMLRGAGSLLGNRQHGHIEALGFDSYLELLNQTIETLKGKEEDKASGGLRVHFPYSIDERYIADTSERIGAYKRILEASKIGDIDRLKDELEDQYGRLPAEMDRVFYVGAVKLFARKYQWSGADVFIDRVRWQAAEKPVERPAEKKGPSAKAPAVEIIDDRTFELVHGGFADFVRRYAEIAPFRPHP